MTKGIVILLLCMVSIITGSELYDNHIRPKCVFKVKIHYLNGDIGTYNIIAPCNKHPMLTDNNSGYGAPYTFFRLGEREIANVCRYEVLSVDTINQGENLERSVAPDQQ